MAKRLNIEFNAKITPVKPLNDEFTLCKCYVMALDKNRNLSYISKEAADDALPTLFNIPVIGHLYVDDDGNCHMGGHDYVLEKDENGNFKFKSICVPYGVVPEHENSVHYEDIEDEGGDTHTYLVSDVILWTGRFPELAQAVYNEEIYFGQSMEIKVTAHEPLDEDKNYTNITGYTYSALCLLGKSDNPEHHVEPCFPMSRVEPYEFSLGDDFAEQMDDLKKELSTCFAQIATKGGDDMGSTTEQTIGTTEGSAPVVFSSTYGQRMHALGTALPEVTETDSEGDIVFRIRYYVADFDDEYVYVTREQWKSGEGYDELKRGRFTYSYDDDTCTATLTSNFEEMFVRWLTADESAKLDSMRAHYSELLDYQTRREREDREAEFDAAIAEFEYMSENEEFQKIYDGRYEFASVDEMKTACYAVKGKYSLAPKQPAGEIEIPLTGASTEEGDDIFSRFDAEYSRR